MLKMFCASLSRTPSESIIKFRQICFGPPKKKSNFTSRIFPTQIHFFSSLREMIICSAIRPTHIYLENISFGRSVQARTKNLTKYVRTESDSNPMPKILPKSLQWVLVALWIRKCHNLRLGEPIFCSRYIPHGHKASASTRMLQINSI